uniref:cysteine desulfurase n=1 Tax=Macrostomum lignano TaxID=282301 RepID=A0A1I8GC69_9PLAT
MRVFSEFFRVMLSVEMRERREGRVDLSHLEARHVAYCIDLLYGDVQPLDKDSVLDVAYVANFLQLPVATRHCQRLLMRCFTTAELDSAYALFERLSWNEFMDELNRQVRLDSWEDANRVHKFSFDRLLSVLSRPELSVSGEDRVLDVCSRWMDDQRIGVGNGPATAAQRIRLLSCIRQLYLGPDCLTKFRTLAAACGFPGSLPAQPPLNTPFRRLELAAAGAAPADLLMPRCCQERMLFISGPDIQGACLSLFFVDPLELKQQGQQQQLTLHCEQLDAPEFKMRTVELQCCVGGGGCVLFLHETVMNVMYSFVSMPAPSSLYAIDLAGVLPVLRYQGVPDSLIGFRMLCLGSRLYAFGGRDCRMTIRDLVFRVDSVTPGGTMKWDHVPVLLPQPMSELAVLAVPSAALPQSAPDSVNKAAKLDRAAAASRHVLLSGGRTNGDEEGDPRPALNCLYSWARSAACGNSHMDGSSASSAAQQQQEECNKETASLVGLELLAALRAERSESAADVAAGADKRPTDLDLLLADGRLLSVHSTVMRVFSEFFRVMLSVEMRERREGRVDLSHLEARHVAYCIDLLYGDVQPLDKDSVLDVAYVANFLQLPVATRHCQRLLMRCFTTAELDSAYALFERLSWNEFMDELNRQVRLDSWEDANRVHKFSFDRLLSVLSRPELSVSGEDRVLDVCSRWMDDQRIGVGNGPATAPLSESACCPASGSCIWGRIIRQPSNGVQPPGGHEPQPIRPQHAPGRQSNIRIRRHARFIGEPVLIRRWTVVSALESLGPSRPLTSILGGRIFYIGRPHGQEMLRDGLWEFELDNGYEGVTSLHHLRDLPVAMRDATRRETHCVALSVNVSPSGLRSLRQLLLSPSEDADARSSESGGGSRRASPTSRLFCLVLPLNPLATDRLELPLSMSSLTALTAIHRGCRSLLLMRQSALRCNWQRLLGTEAAAAATAAPASTDSTPAAGESPFRPLYLDLQATTPLDPRVLDAMLPYCTGLFGNPHSRSHAYGWETETAVEKARAQVAQLIGADPKEIVFTSGATESNNIAIKGVARFYKSRKRHLITSQTEHKCVLDSLPRARVRGIRGLLAELFLAFVQAATVPALPFAQAATVTYLPVKPSGLLDLASLESAIRPDTALVSVMTVNNEIGVRQPVEKIGALCRSRGVFFHTDAAQAVGKMPIDVNAACIDLMSISGHKLYGPKGVGAIYVRRRPRVRLEPLQSGGGQERGMRSGTVPSFLAVGLGAACQLAGQEMAFDAERVDRLSQRLIDRIVSQLSHVVVNGDRDSCYPGCVNLSFACVEGESLLMALKDVALSSGSACTSASLEPSYVLRAIGADEDLAHSSIRFGIGRFTTEAEVDYTVDLCVRQVRRLRELSPLWEMVQEGVDLKSIQWTQH